jgi:hypothetical protein
MSKLNAPHQNHRVKLGTGAGTTNLLIFIWVLTAVLLPSCASQKAADGMSPPANRILDIVISENAEALILRIKANQSLEYNEVRQVNPKGLLFQFPDTTLDFSKGEFRPPGNEIVSLIRTAEISESNTTASIIFVGLKKDAPYDLIADGTGLQVVFTLPKAAPSEPIGSPGKPAAPIPTPQPVPEPISTATLIKTITAATSDNNLTVLVEADGAIKNYKSFTIVKPPRIVFDLYKIKGPYTGEQKIDVTSKWVKQVRYFSHPDKLRLVLDIHDGFLSDYASFPTPTGLLIQVGEISAKAPEAPAKVN